MIIARARAALPARHKRGPRTVLLVLLVLACGVGAVRAQAPAAIPVGVVAAPLRPITQGASFVGRVEAIERVDVRARVTGFLQDVAFKEGDLVKEGDVLFRIERDTFEAAVQQARGALLQAQATYANAVAQRGRTEELVKTNAAPRSQLDERIAAEQNAQGAIIKADADLKTATVNLGYTEITSPITGEAGRSKITKGNVVGPDSGVLTTVVSRDPIYVTFPVSQRAFLDFQGEAQRRAVRDAVTVRLKFSDGSAYPDAGRVNFVDVTVNRETDSITVRATFPNPRGTLIDGQLVSVSVEGDQPAEKVLVPQSAVIVDQQGTYVFTVVDGKAAIARIKIGGEFGPFSIVDSGLKGGEQVVVQGMDTLRAGAPVTATPVPLPQSAG